MHTEIRIRQSFSSVATNIRSRISSTTPELQRWMASFVKKWHKARIFDLSANWIHNTIPSLAVLAGAAAFGFWWGSISAGLFACVALFFLAGIYNTLRQIVATVRWERDRRIAVNSSRNTSSFAERGELEIGASAIERLRPWVEGETSLTEESAKAYCSVLLDTLGALHPKFAE